MLNEVMEIFVQTEELNNLSPARMGQFAFCP
jgi:hypothetical protein